MINCARAVQRGELNWVWESGCDGYGWQYLPVKCLVDMWYWEWQCWLNNLEHPVIDCAW
jgi:hypothetical protein